MRPDDQQVISSLWDESQVKCYIRILVGSEEVASVLGIQWSINSCVLMLIRSSVITVKENIVHNLFHIYSLLILGKHLHFLSAETELLQNICKAQPLKEHCIEYRKYLDSK